MCESAGFIWLEISKKKNAAFGIIQVHECSVNVYLELDFHSSCNSY